MFYQVEFLVGLPILLNFDDKDCISIYVPTCIKVVPEMSMLVMSLCLLVACSYSCYNEFALDVPRHCSVTHTFI